MFSAKPYKVSTKAIQNGLVRESKKILPLDEFVKNPLAVSFASYNFAGYYFSSIPHANNALAASLAKILNNILSEENKSDGSISNIIDPQVIGSLYSAHLKNYQAYFVSWLIAERLYRDKDLIKSKDNVMSVVTAVIKEFSDKKSKLIEYLKKIKKEKNYSTNEKLFDVLISSLEKTVNIEEINNSEILKFAMKKTEIVDIHKEIKFGIEKRKLLEKWQIWYKRQPAIFEMLEHVTKNMGINVINFQEANGESLRQISLHLKAKKMNYQIVAFSDQTGEEMANPISVEAEGFKAKDGLGFSNAIMFDADRFTLVKSKQLWLSATPEIPSATPGGLAHQKNSITMIILHDKLHNKQFAVFNTHITPVPEGHEFSKEKIIEIVNKLAAESNNIPFIISGDFNTFPDIEKEADHYVEYMRRTNSKDWRDVFNGVVCANKVTERTTFKGWKLDDQNNVLDEKEQVVAPKVLDHIGVNGFHAFGNAFKLMCPVDIKEEDTCQLDLKSELSTNPNDFIEKIKKDQTLSDHQMLAIQIEQDGNPELRPDPLNSSLPTNLDLQAGKQESVTSKPNTLTAPKQDGLFGNKVTTEKVQDSEPVIAVSPFTAKM